MLRMLWSMEPQRGGEAMPTHWVDATYPENYEFHGFLGILGHDSCKHSRKFIVYSC
jgi:hypothetical protein